MADAGPLRAVISQTFPLAEGRQAFESGGVGRAARARRSSSCADSEMPRHLARAISDQGFAAAVRMLGYKTTWNGGQLIRAGRFYPSSKTCSACGAVKAKLALSERVFTCQSCGLVSDRDENAARNLLNLAASGAERLNDCGGTIRPRLARHVR